MGLFLIPIFAGLIVVFGLSLFSGGKNKIKRDSNLNVLLVTLDTTRPDRLGCYGFARAKTPNLDSLAGQGVRFVRAYCPVPLTLPSHSSILTGTLPLNHKVRNNATYSLDQTAVTLAERLKKSSYRTAAFVASFNVDSRFGLDQGFDFYDDRFSKEEMLKTFRSERRADEVADLFLPWLDKNAGNKFFAWVHFYDPHMPYDPPSPFKEEFADSLYDGEIAYMDVHFGRIIERLRELKILDRTLVVVAGDHGEALGEKGEVDHGLFIYDVTMLVPLFFFAGKNLPQGAVIDSRVRVIDIMPSILDFLKMDSNKEIQGVSLLPYIEGGKKEDLPCYLESYYPLETYGWAPLVGLVDRGFKYIETVKSELYNLDRDPAEERNLIDDEKKIFLRLKGELDQTIQTFSSPVEAKRLQRTIEVEERLRSLGYVVGGEVSPETLSNLPDPKDKMDEFRMLYQAKVLELEGAYEESEEYHRKIVELSPNVPWHYVNLAILLVRMQKLNEAIQVLEGGLKRLPESIVLLSRLAHFYMRAGRFQDAYDKAKATLEFQEDYFDGLVIAGWVKANWGQWEEAVQYFQKALEIEPENKLIRMKYAYSIAALGRREEAARIGEELKAESPGDYRIYGDLGIIYTNMGKLDLAEENLKKAVELRPSPDAYLNYAAILERLGRLEEAITYLKLYLEETPEGETPRKGQARRALANWEQRVG